MAGDKEDAENVAEEISKLYLAPPVTEIKLPKLCDGYPVSEWTKWYIAEIKRLNGLVE